MDSRVLGGGLQDFRPVQGSSASSSSSRDVPQIQFIDFVVVEAELEYIIMRQSTEAFGILSVPLGLLALFALGKWCIILLLLVSGRLFSVSG